MSIENRLKDLGIDLPASAPAGAAYTPVVIHERVAYVRDSSHGMGIMFMSWVKSGGMYHWRKASEGLASRSFAPWRLCVGRWERSNASIKC